MGFSFSAAMGLMTSSTAPGSKHLGFSILIAQSKMK
jgi:hypothetical protein